MKYVLSFLLGVLVTAIGFNYYIKDKLQSQIAKSSVESVDENSYQRETPEGFMGFYHKFHSDSLYQLEHIRFPLEGIPSQTEENMDIVNFKWEKDKWMMHRPFDAMEGAYNRSFKTLGDNMVVESIKHTSANYQMQRRFFKDGEDWYLIYYAAMNEYTTAQ